MTPQKTRVLVIDDEPQILRALRIKPIGAWLRGFYTAASGGEALRTAGRSPSRRRRARPRTARHVGYRGARRAAWLAHGAGDRIVGAHGLVGQGRGPGRRRRRLCHQTLWDGRIPGAIAGRGAPGCRPRPTPTSPSSKRRRSTVDLAAKKVTKNGSEVHLTPTEWGMLEMLVRNPRQTRRPRGVCSRKCGVPLRQGDALSPGVSGAVATQARRRSVAPGAPTHRGGNGIPLPAVRLLRQET